MIPSKAPSYFEPGKINEAKRAATPSSLVCSFDMGLFSGLARSDAGGPPVGRSLQHSRATGRQAKGIP